jgi:carbonic anhydrase
MKEQGNLLFCEETDNITSIKEELLKRNKIWANQNNKFMDYNDSLRTVIISCMDSRVPIEKIFDLKPGEALVLRNAGNNFSEDILRSIIVGIYEIKAKNIIVVGHTRCGMAIKDNKEVIHDLMNHLTESMKKELKIDNEQDLIKWFGFFEQGKWNENAEHVADILREKLSKILPKDKIPEIISACYDLDTKKITFND